MLIMKILYSLEADSSFAVVGLVQGPLEPHGTGPQLVAPLCMQGRYFPQTPLDPIGYHAALLMHLCAFAAVKQNFADKMPYRSKTLSNSHAIHSR